MMNRKEKEEYLITMCDKHGFRKDSLAFRKGVSELSDIILDTKIESLDCILDDVKEGE